MSNLITVLTINDEVYEDYRKFPAVKLSSLSEVYFLKDKKIIAEGKIGSSNMGEATVYYNPETMKYFENDDVVSLFRERDSNPVYVGFRFSQYTGQYVGTYPDEDPDRCNGVSIVDKFYFDMGVHSKRYADCEGFGALRKVPNEKLNELKAHFNE